ncbi:MAG: DUF2304 family protein [Candidatus Dojkabacteria bacterium]
MTEIFTYQIIVLIVCALLVLRTIYYFLKGIKSFREVILAIIIWGTFSLVSLFPVVLQDFAHLLGFQLGVNAVLVISTIIIFFLLLRLIVRADTQEMIITRLVRSLALEDLMKNKN